jgi:phosphoribosyl-AMP cyclohydrolase
MEFDTSKLNFKWENKFIIGVAQDSKTFELLMVAYMDKKAVEQTFKTGYAHYYSTSRKKLWKKGEESGNLQKIIKIIPDCDNDTLLLIVEPKGDKKACHTGNTSCFFQDNLFKSNGK